jgi:hypothetical protein
MNYHCKIAQTYTYLNADLSWNEIKDKAQVCYEIETFDWQMWGVLFMIIMGIYSIAI